MNLAIRSSGCALSDKVMASAAAAGDLEMCVWLRRRGCLWSKHVLAAAARHGHQKLCDWLLENGCAWHPDAAYAAAGGGHANLARWLLFKRPASLSCGTGSEGAGLATAAAEGCSLAVLQAMAREWLREESCKASWPHCHHRQRQDVLAAAASSPTPDWRDKVQWLEKALGCTAELRAQAHASCCRAAALPDAVERLTWLRGRGYRAGEDAVRQAASVGNMAALSYLLREANIKVCSSYPAAMAAMQGHMDALRLLHACGCPMDGVMRYAAEARRLAVATWLIKALRIRVTREAQGVFLAGVNSGSVELLGWLADRGCCCLSEDAWLHAALSGCEEALEWLAERGCPRPADGGPYREAALKGDLATLRCLHRLGCVMGNVDRLFEEVAVRGDPATLGALRELAPTWRPREAKFNSWVIRGFPLASLRWLAEEAGCPVDWGAAVEAAGQRPQQDPHLRPVPGRDWAEDVALAKRQKEEQQAILGWFMAEQRRRT